jgi:group I intron endonuclease
MKKAGTIYKITNKITGKVYIGQTTREASARFKDHCRDKRQTRYLSNAIFKYGKSNFVFEEICSAVSIETLNELETYFITLFNTLSPNGYNLTLGGHERRQISEETRERHRKAVVGQPRKKGFKHDLAFKILHSKLKGGTGCPILAEELSSGRKTVYTTLSETEQYGFDKEMVRLVCKGAYGRKTHKGYTFKFMTYVNQSGSTVEKNTEHAQRVGDEPAKAEYNSPKSPQPL